MRADRNVLRFVLTLALLLLLWEGTPTAAQQPLAITLVSLISPVGHGNVASIAIRTAPGAACAITVIYKSGPSRAKGLTPKTADPQGMVTWSWLVGTRTTPGRWPIDVTCSGGGKSGMLRTFFVVE